MTLKDLRESKFRTQIEIAAALHVAVTTVSRWESGVQTPRLPQLRELAEFLGVPPETVQQAVVESQRQAKA